MKKTGKKSPKSKKTNNGITFLPDEPIEGTAGDELNRGKFAKSLAKLILNTSPEHSLVVGVNGKWGSGKSSFLNLLDNELKELGKDEVIIIRFNPWNFSELDQLVRMFFHEIKVGIGSTGDERAAALGEMLDKMGQLLAPLHLIPVVGEVADVIEKSGKAIKYLSDTSIEDLKTKINDKLEGINKKIVVLIDDLDRLSKEEIRLMLRLIRLITDFRNTVYVVAFDKEVVEKALETEQGVSGYEYLKKIVQVSFDLPVVERKFIVKKAKKYIKSLITELNISVRGKLYDNLDSAGFFSFFDTIRDVIQYTNSIALTLPAVKSEVNTTDFLLLEGVRVFCPEAYSKIYQVGSLMYNLSYKSYDENTEKEIKAKFDDLFKEHYSSCSADIEEIVYFLFPQFKREITNARWNDFRRNKRLCDERFFEEYFILGVPEGALSMKEAEEALSVAGNSKKFEGRILGFSKRKLAEQFLDFLISHTDELKTDEVEPVIYALLNAGDKLKIESIEKMLKVHQLISIVIYELLKKIATEQKRIQILKNALEKCESLSTISNVLYEIESFSEAKDNKDVFPSNFIKPFEELVLTKIRESAKNGSLIKTPLIASVLYRWKEWGGVREPRKYALKLKSDKDLWNSLHEEQKKSIDEFLQKYGNK